MYTNTKAKVISPDGETDHFEIKTGVLQGNRESLLNLVGKESISIKLLVMGMLKMRQKTKDQYQGQRCHQAVRLTISLKILHRFLPL